MSAKRVACASGILLACVMPTAHAQPPAPPPRDVVVQHTPAPSDSRLHMDFGDTTIRLPSTFSIGDLTVDGRFQTDTTDNVAGFGATWQATAGMHYRLPGGVDVSGAVIARRGYQLPLFMTTAAGSDVAIATPAQPMIATSRVPVLFDTRLRVRRRVLKRRGLTIDLVGEALNLLNANPSHEVSDVPTPLTSRTLRFGLVFGF